MMKYANKDVCEDCPACGEEGVRSGQVVRLHGDAEGRIMWCATCSHRWLVFGNRAPYSLEEQYTEKYQGFREDAFFAMAIARELDERLSREVPKGGRILDVGCGNGEFLVACQGRGYEVLGVDASRAACGICEQKDVSAICGDLRFLEILGAFDMITMWDVMEHLYCPLEFVQRVRELLKPGGVFVAKVPSFGAANFKLLRGFTGMSGLLLGAPDHLQYFTKSSLRALMVRTGFGSVTWYRLGRLRGEMKGGNLRRRVGRMCKRGSHRLLGNRNLYCITRE